MNPQSVFKEIMELSASLQVKFYQKYKFSLQRIVCDVHSDIHVFLGIWIERFQTNQTAVRFYAIFILNFYF